MSSKGSQIIFNVNSASMKVVLIRCYLCVLIFAGLQIPSCSGPEKNTAPPNIVWITSEDNSMHYLKLFNENGVSTPHIEELAANGIIFRNAFSNAPVCSVARSALISGCYGPRTGSQFHRKIKMVPLPDGLKMFPAYLRQAGYYTANNSKEDYNFFKGEDVWDESGGETSYDNRAEGQPFFYVHNIGVTHESSLHFTRDEMASTSTTNDPDAFRVLPNHPDTEMFRYTNAFYRDRIQEMDRRVGEVVDQLKAEGLLENTIIFYFGDHGGVLPGSKGYLYETGLHVPLVVYMPPNFQDRFNIPPGSSVEGFASFVDFGPTVLNLAGVPVPELMDGIPFLGPDINLDQLNHSDLTFSYADRFDEKYDMVRSVRKGNLKYIRNYQPFNYDGLMNNYRYRMLAYQQWDSLYRAGALDSIQSAFFRTKPPEMLYDLAKDPYETENLASRTVYRDALEAMRGSLNIWTSNLPDLSFYPEHYLIEQAFNDPVAFGREHQSDIDRYIEVANLSLFSFEEVRGQIDTSLNSVDPWERYWGLITCSNFGREAGVFLDKIVEISLQDDELANRVRAAEYLGLNGLGDPVKVMTDALYASNQPAEALLILNSIVLMASFNHQYEFDIDPGNISESVRENDEVQRRILFLTGAGDLS